MIEKIEKKKRGGARPGAGMPKGKKTRKTLAREAAAMYLIRRIEEDIEPLTTALLNKAKEGDISALKEALERGLGKVKETRDINVRTQLPLDEPTKDNSVQEDKGIIQED